MMNDAALDEFLAHCSQQLEARQARMVRKFEFARCDRFAVDLEQGQLVAECQGQAIATATTIPIATYEPNSTLWCWAWSQAELPESRRQEAMPIQGLAQKTGLQLFQAEQFKADAELVWDLTAVACEQLQAMGCYRLAHGNQYMMLALHNVKEVTHLPLTGCAKTNS